MTQKYLLRGKTVRFFPKEERELKFTVILVSKGLIPQILTHSGVGYWRTLLKGPTDQICLL